MHHQQDHYKTSGNTTTNTTTTQSHHTQFPFQQHPHHPRAPGQFHNMAAATTTDLYRSAYGSDYLPAGSTAVSKHAKTSSRPPVLRKNTSQSASKTSKNPRDRERDGDDERRWDENRECFPDYCPNCDREFVPRDVHDLYCSESCRMHDQNHTSAPITLRASLPTQRRGSTQHSYYASLTPEPRDIIPRAAPSRPTPNRSSIEPANSLSAISSLRSLTTHTTSSYSSHDGNNTGIWPFTKSSAMSPRRPLARPPPSSLPYSYDNYYTTGSGLYSYPSPSALIDRPLPSRRPTGAYTRPKSIELVTPIVQQ